MENDYKYGRETLYGLVERGQDAIDGILDLCKETEHPRAYEVAGQLIKTVADVSKDLLELQEKLKKIKDVPNKRPKSVTNALFVGSTTELQKLLKDKKISLICLAGYMKIISSNFPSCCNSSIALAKGAHIITMPAPPPY